MKRIFLCVLLLCFGSSCLAAEEFNFRGVTWGMTRDEVRAVETGQFIEPDELYDNQDFLAYKVPETIYSFNGATVTYMFAPPIVRGRSPQYADGVFYMYYGLPDYEVYDNDVAADFERLLADIAVEYGAPDLEYVHKTDKEIYACDESREPTGNYGTKHGFIFCVAHWEREDCNIEALVRLYDMSCAFHMLIIFRPPGFSFEHKIYNEQ